MVLTYREFNSLQTCTVKYVSLYIPSNVISKIPR